MKYIRYQRPYSFEDGVILFDDSIVHADMARGLQSGTVVSAGFVTRDLNTLAIKVFGRSESLNLEPDPGDESLITHHFGFIR